MMAVMVSAVAIVSTAQERIESSDLHRVSIVRGRIPPYAFAVCQTSYTLCVDRHFFLSKENDAQPPLSRIFTFAIFPSL
jgi:hypothetical protein